MMVRQVMFDEFFTKQLPDEGFTMEEIYNDYFGLIDRTKGDRPELHGYTVGLDGHVRVPELAPKLDPLFVNL